MNFVQYLLQQFSVTYLLHARLAHTALATGTSGDLTRYVGRYHRQVPLLVLWQVPTHFSPAATLYFASNKITCIEMDSACPVVKSIKSLNLFLLMQSQTFKYLYCRKQNCFVARGDTPETKTFLFLFLGMIHQGNKNVFVSCVSYLKTKTETILFSWCIIPKNKNKNVFVAGVSSALGQP